MTLKTIVIIAVLVIAAVNIASGRHRYVESTSEAFDNLIARKIQENEKRGGNVHGHIVAVNDAWRLAASQPMLDNDGDIPLVEDIEAANEEANVDLFEGDIILPNDEEEDTSQSEASKKNVITSQSEASKKNVITSQSEASKKNVITNKNKVWPKQVSYYVSPRLNYMSTTINEALKALQKKTCVRFKKVSSNFGGDHIRLVKGSGCSSSIGRRGGRQTLSLGTGCNYVGVVIHEMMHSLGVWHEQSRPDRDKYVEVLWNNVKKGRAKNFRKYSHGQLDALNLPYDTSSIMHYDRFLFSVAPGRKPTIIARGKPWKKLGGQSSGTLTANDVKEINSLFSCT